jgi:hypothetical protein
VRITNCFFVLVLAPTIEQRRVGHFDDLVVEEWV